MSQPKVVCAGLSNLDHVWQVERFPPVASRTPAHSYRVQGGGPAATASATLARLGAEVHLYALHGDDANGLSCLQSLQTFGVRTEHVRTVPNAQTCVSAVLVDGRGERRIFPYKPDLPDSAEGLDLRPITGANCVLSDSRHPVMNEAVLEAARANSVPVVGDFGNTDNWHLSSYTDYLLVSRECAAQVLGRDDPEAALDALRQSDEQLVGVTLGEEGFIYAGADGLRHVPALVVNALDTTGAGDVFHGAYAFGVASGFVPERCALFASVAAALSCTALGSRGYLPIADEVEELLVQETAKEMDARSWV